MNSPIVLIHGLWLTPRSWGRAGTRVSSSADTRSSHRRGLAWSARSRPSVATRPS